MAVWGILQGAQGSALLFRWGADRGGHRRETEEGEQTELANLRGRNMWAASAPVEVNWTLRECRFSIPMPRFERLRIEHFEGQHDATRRKSHFWLNVTVKMCIKWGCTKYIVKKHLYAHAWGTWATNEFPASGLSPTFLMQMPKIYRERQRQTDIWILLNPAHCR